MAINYKKILSPLLFVILAGAFIYFAFIPSLQKINTDFPNYYVSSNMYLDGKDLKLAYDNAEFGRQLLMYDINYQIVSFVPYPPLTALLMLPIARLAPLDAKLVWNIFNLLLLLACIIVLSRIAELSYFKCGIIFFLSGFALVNNFMFGQVYLVVLLFLLLSMYFMKKDSDILAALFIALSIVLKFYTIFFIFLFIFKKRFKLAAYTIIFSVLIYIPVVLLTGFNLNIYYFTHIIPRLGDGWVGTVYVPEYQSFISLLHRWFDYEPVLNPYPLAVSPFAFYLLKYVYIFTLLTVAVSVIKAGAQNLKLELSLFCIACLLLLPVNASYQFVVLIPSAVILYKHFADKKKYILASSIVLLMFIMNSHLQIYITTLLKNTPFYLFTYVKLFGLLLFFALNVKVLLNVNSEKLFGNRTVRFIAIGSICVIVFTALSFTLNKPIDDRAEFIDTGKNYLSTMPAAFGERLIWVEPVNEKFVLRSNFGFSYDKHNSFYPVFIDSNHIAFEIFEGKNPRLIALDMGTGIERGASGLLIPQYVSASPDRLTKSFSKDGMIYTQKVNSENPFQMTSGRQICTYPVFANDSTIIFSSDRNRGVGFSAFYKMNLRTAK